MNPYEGPEFLFLGSMIFFMLFLQFFANSFYKIFFWLLLLLFENMLCARLVVAHLFVDFHCFDEVGVFLSRVISRLEEHFGACF
jgi:hypothetical protein